MTNIVKDSVGRILKEGEEKIYNTEIDWIMDIEKFNTIMQNLPIDVQFTFRDKWETMAAKFAFENGEVKKNFICDEVNFQGHLFKECFGDCFIEYKYLGKI